jgi:hypothetical protein
VKRKLLSKINWLDADDALAPRRQPLPSQENLQDLLISPIYMRNPGQRKHQTWQSLKPSVKQHIAFH